MESRGGARSWDVWSRVYTFGVSPLCGPDPRLLSVTHRTEVRLRTFPRREVQEGRRVWCCVVPHTDHSSILLLNTCSVAFVRGTTGLALWCSQYRARAWDWEADGGLLCSGGYGTLAPLTSAAWASYLSCRDIA